MEDIPHPDFYWIHPQYGGQLTYLHLGGKCPLRAAEATKSAGRNIIGINRIDIDFYIRDLIGSRTH